MNHEAATPEKLACHDLTGVNLWAALMVGQNLSVDAPDPLFGAFTAEVMPRLPRWVGASQTIRSTAPNKGSSRMRLQEGVLMPWVCLNTSRFVNAIAVDIDHADARQRLAAIPAEIRPTWMEDPCTGRAHAVLLLKNPVCIGEDGAPGPQKLLRLAHRLLAAALDATLIPYGCLIKSPWGKHENLIGTLLHRPSRTTTPAQSSSGTEVTGGRLLWRTHVGAPPVALREVVSLLMPKWQGSLAKDQTASRGQADREPSSLGRNCALFDRVRWWCYDGVIRDPGEISAYAHWVNSTFPVPLPRSEVTSIARSITRFMNERYDGGRRDRRRRMTFSAEDLTTQQKQAEAGKRTAVLKQEKSRTLIVAALKGWPDKTPLTQTALARATGLCERTIRRHWGAVWPTGLSVALSGDNAFSALLKTRTPVQSLADLAAAHNQDVDDNRNYDEIVGRNARRGAAPEMPGTPTRDIWNPAVMKLMILAWRSYEDAGRRAKNRIRTRERRVRKERLIDAGERGDRTLLDDLLAENERKWQRREWVGQRVGWSWEERQKSYFSKLSVERSVLNAYCLGVSGEGRTKKSAVSRSKARAASRARHDAECP